MSDLMVKALAAIFPDKSDRLYYLQEKTEADYFTGPYRDVWTILTKIGTMTGGKVASKDILMTSLDRAHDLPIERRAAIEDAVDAVLNYGTVSDSDFRASIVFLEEDYQKNSLVAGLSDAMDILTSGTRKGNETIYGVEPAVETLHETLAEVERIDQGHMPEGSVYDEKELLMKELQSSEAMMRIRTGVDPLDELTNGGIGAGELWLIAAFAGVGKTFFCSSVAYHQAIFEGANVVYLTAETLREQVIRRMLVRHSRHPKFGIPNGLSSSSLKKHTPEGPILTPQQVEQWQEVINDFSTKSSDRGELHVAQIPLGAKVSTIHAKLNKINTIFPVDLVVIDSLDLLSPETRRDARREELNEILTKAKHTATAFDGGRGVRILSPWQTGRVAWKEAHEKGRYTKDSLAETAETERKADLILALLEDRNNEYKLKAQTLKFRDDSEKDFELDIDYDKSYVGSNTRIGAVQEHDILEASGLVDL